MLAAPPTAALLLPAPSWPRARLPPHPLFLHPPHNCVSQVCQRLPRGRKPGVSTIRNDVSKNENSTEVLKLKKQIDYWKEQAGLPPHKRDYVDLEDVQGEGAPGVRWCAP